MSSRAISSPAACRVARARRYLDVHHIVFKSKRGSNKASNLITLCSGHHQQLHDGKLAVMGTAPHALTFTWPDDPTRISTRARLDPRGPVDRVPELDLPSAFERAARSAEEALRAGPVFERPTGSRTKT